MEFHRNRAYMLAHKNEIVKINAEGNGFATVDPDNDGSGLPSQTGNSGKFLKTNGSAASWDDVPSSGGGITNITYAALVIAIGAGTLTKGALYNITDATHSQNPIQVDLGIVVLAIDVDAISLNGTGAFLNADYQAVGDYSGVSGFVAQRGQWTATIDAAVVDNDVVIWNKLHYLVADASAVDGTDPATNTTAYSLLTKATANVGYIEEYDYVEYDFVNDWMTAWVDKRGNIGRQSFLTFQDYGQDFYSVFQWGNNKVWGNTFNQSIIEILNNSNTIQYCTASEESDLIANNNTGIIGWSTLRNAGVMNANDNTGNITYCGIEENSAMQSASNAGHINLCKLMGGSSPTINMNIGKTITDCSFGNGINNVIDGTKNLTNQAFQNLLEFADNAAALVGGLQVNATYKITGTGTVNVVI